MSVERQIQNSVFNTFGSASLAIVPNYTPRMWFEADLLRITKAGYAEEFEIKISVSDFKADALKGPSEHEKLRMQFVSPAYLEKTGFDERTKHQRLAAGDARGPCRFSFVVTPDIASKIEVPEWAGLYVAHIEQRSFPVVTQIKTPPQLHKAKADTRIVDHIRHVFYNRYWNIRRGLAEATDLSAEPETSLPQS